MAQLRDVVFYGHVCEADASLVRQKLGDALYRSIKARDKDPCFGVWRVMGEGTSLGGFAAEGGAIQRFVATAKKWLRPAIVGMAAKLNPSQNKAAIPCVLVHPTGATDNRKRAVSGEVLAGWPSQDRHGKVAANAITYHREPAIKAKLRKGIIDTCSVEARVAFERAADGVAQIIGTDRVTALLVGSRERLTAAGKAPGYAGATLMATVAELSTTSPPADMDVDLEDYVDPVFIDRLEPDDTDEISSSGSGDPAPEHTPYQTEDQSMSEQTATLTRDDVRRYIRSEGLKIADVFDRDVIDRDPAVISAADEARSKASTPLTDDIAQLKAALETAKSEAAALRTEVTEQASKLLPYQNDETLAKLRKVFVKNREEAEQPADEKVLEFAVKDVRSMTVPDGQDREAWLMGKVGERYEYHQTLKAAYQPEQSAEPPTGQQHVTVTPGYQSVRRVPQATPSNPNPPAVKLDPTDWEAALD